MICRLPIVILWLQFLTEVFGSEEQKRRAKQPIKDFRKAAEIVVIDLAREARRIETETIDFILAPFRGVEREVRGRVEPFDRASRKVVKALAELLEELGL